MASEVGELEGFTMVEIPWGTWGEAHSRRRHQGRQGAVLLAELIRRRPGGGHWGLLAQHAPSGSPTGSHPPADSRVHLLPGAGKDSATAAEHPAQAVHPGIAPGMGQEAMGQSWLARVGMSFAVPWAQGGILYSAQPETGDVPLARQEFNLASLTRKGEKG